MKYYKISEGALKELIRESKFLDALEAGGVDNWCGYEMVEDEDVEVSEEDYENEDAEHVTTEFRNSNMSDQELLQYVVDNVYANLESELDTDKYKIEGVGATYVSQEYLDELEFLAETAGATGDRKFVQRLDKPEKATYIRSGKLQEIAEYCEENEIAYVIFDDELTGMQQRNIEKVIKCGSVIDRTSLILEIFGDPFFGIA